MHYSRWKTTGDPGPVGKLIGRGVDPEIRFWSRVDRRADDECWPWQGYIDPKWGYGVFHVGQGKSFKAHRYAYELLVGPIPEGLQIDHLCRRPSCVNPRHMEPVTAAEHNLRTHGPRDHKTHCPQGHPYNEENSYYKSAGGHRMCKPCLWAAQRRYQQRRRAAQG